MNEDMLLDTISNILIDVISNTSIDIDTVINYWGGETPIQFILDDEEI